MEETYDPDEEFGLTAAGIEKIMDEDLDDLDEAELMILRYVASREMLDTGLPTMEEIERVCEWMREIQIGVGLLENVLDGNIAIDFIDNEPVFKILPKGQLAVRELLDDLSD